VLGLERCMTMTIFSRIRAGIGLLATTVFLASIARADSAPAPPPTGLGLHYYYPAAQVIPRTVTADVCIYGGTSAGVAAAVQLARMGKSAVLLEPGIHLGGLSSGGLGNTDIGNKAAIGGIAREFYQRVGQHYGTAENWRFEPHVAEAVFQGFVTEAKTPVYYQEYLKSVSKDGAHLVSLTTESGLTVQARAFIDATYEGDLMAHAHVQYAVGRESNATYGETLDGVQVLKAHQFDRPVDPYVAEGNPASGLLPGVNPGPVAATGTGDNRIQAYDFRLCLTREADNRIPYDKPDGYDPSEYVLLTRYLATGADDPKWQAKEIFQKFDAIAGQKYDKNNFGAVSTDYIGRNYAWPDADYATREKIFQAHVTYQKGLMWFLGNDPSVPQAIRDRWNGYGLCQDEFTGLGGWSPELYIREARRMVSDYVMTEANCRGKEVAPEGIGLAAYTMDSHNCERFVDADGHVRNEGNVEVAGFPPYPIGYGAIVPKAAEADNLLVPVCLSASHIAYGSIRMEPVFMVLGQSAGTAAALALDEGVPVQKVDYGALRARLLADHQVLDWVPQAEDAPAPPATVAPVDDTVPAPPAQPVPAAARELGPKARFVQALEAGKPQVIVAYGTSLTQYGAWVGQLQKALDAAYPGLAKVINSGGAGQYSKWGVDNLQTKVIANHPDAVFIEFTTNDAVDRFHLPVDGAKQNTVTIINGIQAALPQCEIILQVMSPVIDHPEGTSGHRSHLELYQQMYRDLGKERGLLVIDHMPAWQAVLDQGPDLFRKYVPDGLHPGGPGNALFVTPEILRAIGIKPDNSNP